MPPEAPADIEQIFRRFVFKYLIRRTAQHVLKVASKYFFHRIIYKRDHSI